jgi:hypothetical protein
VSNRTNPQDVALLVKKTTTNYFFFKYIHMYVVTEKGGKMIVEFDKENIRNFVKNVKKSKKLYCV